MGPPAHQATETSGNRGPASSQSLHPRGPSAKRHQCRLRAVGLHSEPCDALLSQPFILMQHRLRLSAAGSLRCLAPAVNASIHHPASPSQAVLRMRGDLIAVSKVIICKLTAQCSLWRAVMWREPWQQWPRPALDMAGLASSSPKAAGRTGPELKVQGSPWDTFQP